MSAVIRPLPVPGAPVPGPGPGPGPIPLCVDLDGTLVHGDLLIESLLDLISRRPVCLLWAVYWLLCGGKARLKHEVAQRSTLDAARLRYDRPFLQWLRAMAGRRRLILCTGADERLARQVARHVGLFEEVIASDRRCNLTGRAKARALQARFGAQGYDYAGNAVADRYVWSFARRAIVVNASDRTLRAARRATQVECIFRADSRTEAPALLRAMRPRQWLKNLLLLVPLLAAHRALDPVAVGLVALAMVAFSLCALGIYLVNDLLDLGADRTHPRKRMRPLAAGELDLRTAVGAAAVAAGLALSLGATLSTAFAGLLVLYMAVALAYSMVLKRVAILDTVVLAGLYTLRVIAGAVAIEVPLSFWLLMFSMFIFLSLALVKRYSELALPAALPSSDGLNRRDYARQDGAMLASLGAASGYLSVLVLALYINGPSVALYQRPQVLWLLCPLLLYWVSRVWLLAQRGVLPDDPLQFFTSDRVSLAIGLMGTLAVLFAI